MFTKHFARVVCRQELENDDVELFFDVVQSVVDTKLITAYDQDKEEVGVIAQEIEAVLPQLVTPSAFAGYKTVKYDKLTALLVEAVKAQQLQIDALRAEIAKLAGSATTEL